MAYPANLTLPYPDFVPLTAIKKAEIVADYTEIQNWVMAMADAAAGHDHSASANKGPQIPTAGIADLAITTPKIGDGQVTGPKLANQVGTHAWGKPLGSIAYKRVSLDSVPTATTSVYTVPAGKKALVSGPGGYNGTAAAITITEYLVPSGGAAGAANMIRQQSVATVSSYASYSTAPALLPEGASIQVVAGAAGISAAWSVTEMDASEPLVGVSATNLPTGDTTVYTCPAGKTAKLFRDIETTPMQLFNPTAAAIDVLFKLLPSGGVAATLHKVSVAAGGAGSQFWPVMQLTLNAGDAFIVNASAAGINVWGVFVEV